MTQSITTFARGVPTNVIRLVGSHIVTHTASDSPVTKSVQPHLQYRNQVVDAIRDSQTPNHRQTMVVVPVVDENGHGVVRGMFGNDIMLPSDELGAEVGMPVRFISSTEALAAHFRSGLARTSATVHPPTSDLTNPASIDLTGEIGIMEVLTVGNQVAFCAGVSQANGEMRFGPTPTIAAVRDDEKNVLAVLNEMMHQLAGVSNVMVCMDAREHQTALRLQLVRMPWEYGVLAVVGCHGGEGIIMGIRQLIAVR